MSDPLKPQSQTSNDACPPTSAGTRHQNDVKFVSQERMSVLGLEGQGLPLAPPPGPGRIREALNALLKRYSVTTLPLLAFVVRLRVPLQRVQPVLLECWMAAAVRMQRARHVLFERWMAADFRTRQLPILAIAAAIWASTAWMAWRADDSATPLLRQLAATNFQRAHPVDPARRGSPTTIAEPVDPQAAVRPGSLTQQTSRSLSLTQIMQFLISGSTPRHKRLANPGLQVWTDTHTGLYYCPGDGGYHWRSRGRLMSQKEAQDNYFQPASGAACP